MPLELYDTYKGNHKALGQLQEISSEYGILCFYRPLTLYSLIKQTETMQYIFYSKDITVNHFILAGTNFRGLK